MVAFQAWSDPLGLWQVGELDVVNVPGHERGHLAVEVRLGVEEHVVLNLAAEDLHGLVKRTKIWIRKFERIQH